MIVYKIDVLEALKAEGYTTHTLRHSKLIGEANIQRLRRGEMVGIITLNTICSMLDKQPGDIIAFRPDLPNDNDPG